MVRKPPAGLFITGTGTSVGKTRVGCAIARHLRAAGLSVGVYKPAASGCRRQGDRLISDDAAELWQAAGRPGTLDEVCPQCFEAPLAPHLAARAEGRRIDAELLRSGIEVWRQRSDVVLVEGAGGLMSPLGEEEYVAHLAYELGYPLLVVTRNALGTIHDTLATLIVAATFCEGLDVAGVVVNEPVDPATADDASLASNVDELHRRCGPPVLGMLRWQAEQIEPAVDWMALARVAGG